MRSHHWKALSVASILQRGFSLGLPRTALQTARAQREILETDMPLTRPNSLFRLSLALGTLAVGLASGTAAGQSLTAGSLKGHVRTADGVGVGAVDVTVEPRAGGSALTAATAADGTFQFRLIAPGEYSILVERSGYQPIRWTGALIAPGRLTNVVIEIERRPPPITEVIERSGPTASGGVSQGRLVVNQELVTLDRRRDVGDVSRGITDVVVAADGREGFALAAAGLPSSMSRIVVDGVLETMLRHPGVGDEPARAPLFHRGEVDQAQVIGVPLDGEWRSAPGTILSVQTRRGGNRVAFRPYASFSSATLGGRQLDNPGDSSATAFQVGAVVSGALVPDTAHFLLRFDYQLLEQPAPQAWERDSARFGSQAVSLRAALPTIASDSFGVQVGGLVGAPVRTYRSGGGFGRVDWRVGAATTVAARAGFVSWKERGWSLGSDLASGAGTTLDARDGSAAITVTSAGENSANELRAGFNLARREHLAASIPHTTIVDNGAGFGTPLALPGLFDSKVADISNAFQRQVGDHRVKVGANATFVNYRQDYRFGSGAAFAFGDLSDFGRGRGAFVQVEGPLETAQFTSTEVGVFVQDTWTITPEIQLLFAFRYEIQRLPQGKVLPNVSWLTLTGVRNDSIPRDKRGFAPRVGFVWDVQNRGEWIVRGGGGLYPGRLDPATFAEAILFDRDVQVRRGIGDFSTWPIAPDPTLAPEVGQRLTVISDRYRAPRTAKFEFGITRRLTAALFHVSASYHHSDFLLRRQDLNRGAITGTTQEGRPVYGTLIQRAAMVLPAVGSNRRFSDFDLVSGLSPTGFADHYELSATLERQVADRISVIASYTYSKTTDNLLGLRSADPVDQLNPFPEGLNGADWSRGRSDFDVPHRASVIARYRSVARAPITVAARYRVRSGLPFTAGFRPGVDVNGDGSGGNDPAFLNGSLAGLPAALAGGRCGGPGGGAFALRNGCREELSQALDAHLSIALPFGGRGDRVAIRIDAFNLIATGAGVIDRALLSIDPTGTLTTDGSGNVTLPLVVNPGFGSLLVRRGEPRMVRVGLSMEY